jgi:hypothetical protein
VSPLSDIGVADPSRSPSRTGNDSRKGVHLIPTVHPRTDLFKVASRQAIHRTLVIGDQFVAEKSMNDTRVLQFVREAKDGARTIIAQPARILPPQSSQSRQTGPAKRTNLVDHVRQ